MEKLKVLILPKFEIGEMTGDAAGEAQLYYEAYLQGSTRYEVPGCTTSLYVKDGVGLILTGMGKVNAASTLLCVLLDPRFDFSEAYVLSTGCAGSAAGYGVMGDVFVITATIDFDMGHHADARELTSRRTSTWFHDEIYDNAAFRLLDPALCSRVYALVQNTPLETTARTRAFMRESFGGAAWACRDPKVLRGTTVTSDNYWKGNYGHESALLMAKTYGAPDPYAVTEMEDHALAVVLDRCGMLNRLIILRDSVGADVFMNGDTPERLWSPETIRFIADEDCTESADIFFIAQKNNFRVGQKIIDAILAGRL